MYARGVQDFAGFETMYFPVLHVASASSSSGIDVRGKRGAVIQLTTGIWSSGGLVINVQDAAPKSDGTAPSGGDYADIADAAAVTIAFASGGADQTARIAVMENGARSFLRIRLSSVTGNPGIAAGLFTIDPHGAGVTAESWDLIIPANAV